MESESNPLPQMTNQTSAPTILVTGSSGFLGQAIVDQLRTVNCKLTTSGRRKSPPINLPNYTAVDLLDRTAVARLTEGVDVVIHAAGLAHLHRTLRPVSADYFRVNSTGTANIAQAAASAGCRRFIYVSSVAVYGTGWPTKTEEATCLPKGAYAQSKFEGEQIAAEIAASAGMELIVLRMATLYGENDPGNVGRLMRLIDRHQFLWIGRGENRKSLIHVDEAARACVIAACCRDLPNRRTYNVAAQPCKMHTIVSTLAANLGRREPPLRLPPGLPLVATAVAAKLPGVASRAQRVLATLEKWLSDEVYDGALFHQTFGWSPKTSLQVGIARQVACYRRTGNSSPTTLEPTNGNLHATGRRVA